MAGSALGTEGILRALQLKDETVQSLHSTLESERQRRWRSVCDCERRRQAIQSQRDVICVEMQSAMFDMT